MVYYYRSNSLHIVRTRIDIRIIAHYVNTLITQAFNITH